MSKKNESVSRTIIVAISLCLVCSIAVSSAAILLRPEQINNKQLDKQKNILQVVGLLSADASPQELFDKYVEARVIDLATGEFVDTIDPLSYDEREAAKDPTMSKVIPPEQDIASIKRLPEYMPVYLIKQNQELQYIVLPIKGYGLWSTLYGFVALKPDLNTVYGLSFYDHKETPGLGGEVDNPRWQALWHGKKIYNNSGAVALEVIKGQVDQNTANAEYKVDGLAGATLTSRGVSNMIKFWLSAQGYQPFLQKLSNQGVANR